MDSVLINRPCKDTGIHREKKVHVKIDTEIGVVYPSKAKKEESKDFPLEPLEGTLQHLDFGL